MRYLLFLVVPLCLALDAGAQNPSIRDADRIRLAEAFRLADSVRDDVWPAFPYDSAAVAARFSEYRDAVRQALAAHREPTREVDVQAYLAAKNRLRNALSAADYRYLSFQLWQEGIARYVEYRVAEMAAVQYEPLPAFRAMDDVIPYAVAADSLREALDEELATLDLGSERRVAFYPLGAAEALLLDAVQPDWHAQYFVEKFYLERYHEDQE